MGIPTTPWEKHTPGISCGVVATPLRAALSFAPVTSPRHRLEKSPFFSAPPGRFQGLLGVFAVTRSSRLEVDPSGSASQFFLV